MRNLIIGLLMLTLTGCAAAITKVADPLISRDLTSFAALAAKYGTPEEQRCATYLQGAWGDKAALAAEDADGLLANVYKAILLSRHINQNEQLFQQECGAMAGAIMIEIGRTLRK